MKTQTKITAAIVLTALVSSGVFAGLSYVQARNVVTEAAFSDLEALRNAKAADIEEFFDKKTNAADMMARDVFVATALTDLQSAYRNINEGGETVLADVSSNVRDYYERQALPPIAKALGVPNAAYDTYGPKTRAARHLQHIFNVKLKASKSPKAKTYEALHSLYDDKLKSMAAVNGFADILLIDTAKGDVIYSGQKGLDFGTNVYSGAFAKSILGLSADAVRNTPSLHISDIDLYAPARSEASVFITTPIYDQNVAIGILALRLKAAQVSALSAFGLTERTDRDVYLAGGDYLMRSNAPYAQFNLNAYVRQFKDAGGSAEVAQKIKLGRSTVLAQKVETNAVAAALRGDAGVITTQNYLGHSVVSAYAPLTIGKNDWVILADRKTETVQTPFTPFAARLGIAAAIFLPLLLLLSLWLASRLMRPARAMARTARAISDGENLMFTEDKTEWGRIGAELNKVAGLDIWPAPTIAGTIEPRKPIKLISIEMPKKSKPKKAASEKTAPDHGPVKTESLKIEIPGLKNDDTSKLQALKPAANEIQTVVEKPSVAVWGLKPPVNDTPQDLKSKMKQPSQAPQELTEKEPMVEVQAEKPLIEVETAANIDIAEESFERLQVKPKSKRAPKSKPKRRKRAARSDTAVKSDTLYSRTLAPRAKKKSAPALHVVTRAARQPVTPSTKEHDSKPNTDVLQPLVLTKVIDGSTVKAEAALDGIKNENVDTAETPLVSDEPIAPETVPAVPRPRLTRRRRRRR